LSPFGRVTGVRRDPLSLVGLAVALLLVAAPFWVLPHAGEASTTYAAERLEYAPGGGIDADGPIRGLDCYADELTRGCLFAERIVAEGPVTVRTTETVLSASSFEDAPYVAVGTDPPFRHRRVSAPANATDGRIRYALEPVGPGTVLREVSVDEAALPPGLDGVLAGREVTVRGRTFDVDGLVVRSGGAYYRVHVVASSEPTWDGDHPLVLLARGLPVAVGLGVLRARWRDEG
jgi:hypothetical protein